MLGVSEDVADWLAVPDADAPCDSDAVAVVEKDGLFVPVVVVLGVCIREVVGTQGEIQVRRVALFVRGFEIRERVLPCCPDDAPSPSRAHI
jgi:hypothetical protein